MGFFGKSGIRVTKAGEVLDEAKRDVKRPRKDEVAAKRQQKNQGGKK